MATKIGINGFGLGQIACGSCHVDARLDARRGRRVARVGEHHVVGRRPVPVVRRVAVRVGAGVDGRAILRGWQTGRIDIGAVVAQPSFRCQPTPAPTKVAPTREVVRARSGTSQARPERLSLPATLPVLLPMIALASVFLIDQASKLGVAGSPRAGLAGGLSTGVELLGLALAGHG